MSIPLTRDEMINLVTRATKRLAELLPDDPATESVPSQEDYELLQAMYSLIQEWEDGG